MDTSNYGVASARNTGVEKSTGDYLFFLDSDDCWLPQKLDKHLQLHQERKQLRISQTEEVWFRQGKRVNQRYVHAKPEGEAFSEAVKSCIVSPSSVCLRRDLWNEVGGFDVDFRVCED